MKIIKIQVIQTVKFVEVDPGSPGATHEVQSTTVFLPEVFDVSVLNLDGIARDSVTTLRKMMSNSTDPFGPGDSEPGG
jgi:hypothetical protein